MNAWRRIVAHGVVAVLIVATAAELHRQTGLNHDVAWYLYIAESVRHGSRLYLDAPGSFVEVNPPLVIWLFLPILRLADLFKVPAVWTPAMLIAAEAAVGVSLSALILGRVSQSLARFAWIMAIVALLLPGHAFAQREHQVFVLLLPALSSLAVNASSRGIPKWLRVSAGAAAGVGCALKPYFAIGWLLVEVCVALWDGRPRQVIRIETVTGAIVVVLYGLAVLIIEPAYLALMRTWGPLYLQMNVQSLQRLISASDCVLSVIIFALVFPISRLGEWGRLAFVFATASLAFIVAVLLQRKGFDYHWLPSFAFGALALAAALRAVDGMARRAIPVVICSALMLVIAAFRTARGVEIGRENRRLATAYGAALAGDATAGTARQFVVLSTNLGHAFPMAVMIGGTWPLRWPSLWALETASTRWCSPPAGRDEALEQRVRDDLWEDLTRSVPRTIIVAQLPGQLPSEPGCLTFVDHLSTEQRFVKLFAAYEVRDTIPSSRYGTFLVLHHRSGESDSRRW